MSFAVLALICLVALLGPLLASRQAWHIPVVLGELLAGLVLGRSGLEIIDASDQTFGFLAQIGFAMVMFVAGSHVPMRDDRIRPALRGGLARVGLIVLTAVGLGLGFARIFSDEHWMLYAVIMASSSAAIVLPMLDSLRLGGPKVIALLPVIAMVDVLCIVTLPLALDPGAALRALIGVLAVIGGGLVAYLLLARIEATGLRRRIHVISEDRLFAVELRVSLVILFALSALAVLLGVSVMLAGFVLGLAVARVGEPRRVANQVFAITEGLFAPVFFVWLGSSLDLGDLAAHPMMILLGVALAAGSLLAHLTPMSLGQPLSLSVLSAAQMGVPIAATTIGTQMGVLSPGEGSALILSVLLTLAAAMAGGAAASSRRVDKLVSEG
ncbi:MAG TPA: cation:proton antiporter [Marmoricola sp.]|nr:cation:proton antiporter [Marmoricola sp.]